MEDKMLLCKEHNSKVCSCVVVYNIKLSHELNNYLICDKLNEQNARLNQKTKLLLLTE